MPVPQDQGDGQAAGNILLALLADLELDPENRVEAAPRARDTNQAEEGGGGMRRWLRMVWRRFSHDWAMFREALHGEIVFRQHRKGRCTWVEEPSHGSFRWRKCEYTFCDKREYMADTSARWAPVTSPEPEVVFPTRRHRHPWPEVRDRAMDVSPVEEMSHQINAFYQGPVREPR